jgi:O-antigen ligase
LQRALLILLVAASYLLFAGADPGALAALITFAAAVVVTAPRRVIADFAHGRALDAALLAIAAALLLQVVPLPAAIVNTIAPNRAELMSTLRINPLGAPGSWTTLSISPYSTWLALATFCLGVLSYWGARAVFGAGGNTRAFCRALTFMAALFAVMAIVQRAIAPRTLLFMIEPEARSANPFGAFVNRNHFAAWLLLACGPVTGYVIARARTHPSRGHFRASFAQVMRSGTLFTAMAVFLIIGTLLLVLSRSAVAGLGAAAVAGWWLARPRLSIERTSLPTIFGFAGAVILIFVVFVDTDRWAERLQQSFTSDVGFSRLSIWRESMPMVRDFWMAGTGAGTYSEAMSHYQQTRMWVGSMNKWAHFNNAHSHYLQVVTEGATVSASSLRHCRASTPAPTAGTMDVVGSTSAIRSAASMRRNPATASSRASYSPASSLTSRELALPRAGTTRKSRRITCSCAIRRTELVPTRAPSGRSRSVAPDAVTTASCTSSRGR